MKMPGADSGRMIFQARRSQPAPRSVAASISEWSIAYIEA